MDGEYEEIAEILDSFGKNRPYLFAIFPNNFTSNLTSDLKISRSGYES